MKTLSGIATLSLGLLLVGCASTQKTTYHDAQPLPRTTASSRVDEKYVAYVESVARRRGTQVMWVNTPQKRVPRPATE